MLIALACVTLVALATLAFAHSLVRDHREARAQWTLERRELLERIQRPHLVPAVADRESFDVPEDREPSRWSSEWARVGQIEIDDKYGLSDDED